MNSTDSAEVRELYRTYGFLIYGRCLRILGSADDAKDAMQAVFLKLIENLDRIRDRERIVVWIYNAAKNHCFNVLRDNKKFDRGVEPDEIHGPDDFGERFETREIIRLLTGVRSKKVRDAAHYTFVEGLEQQEIRKLTGQSPATVRRNLARFKDHVSRMRERLGLR